VGIKEQETFSFVAKRNAGVHTIDATRRDIASECGNDEHQSGDGDHRHGVKGLDPK
jgi:hypothetical protein